MAWLDEQKWVWRVVLAALLIAALVGPWAFDKINVPAKYPCTAPNIRLYGDFCGLPMSFIKIAGFAALWSFTWAWGFITGELMFTERINELALGLVFGILLLLLAAPLVGMLRLKQKETRRRQKQQVVFWALVSGACLVFALVTSPDQIYWALWGVWLYGITAAAGLCLEALMLARGSRLGTG